MFYLQLPIACFEGEKSRGAHFSSVSGHLVKVRGRIIYCVFFFSCFQVPSAFNGPQVLDLFRFQQGAHPRLVFRGFQDFCPFCLQPPFLTGVFCLVVAQLVVSDRWWW
ncbi:hypothetical protein O6H91_08G090100 [Diphasiastrum complanatum]|uniref:Uncharacterized protein n=1 Tax=Diphasiastrum complanatum TaxID=34168 RepID=A0ACC2CZX1_DIPCM|nr:hypothetical protein O6H91_08G090100 [Diphasiastrum complanatum]